MRCRTGRDSTAGRHACRNDPEDDRPDPSLPKKNAEHESRRPCPLRPVAGEDGSTPRHPLAGPQAMKKAKPELADLEVFGRAAGCLHNVADPPPIVGDPPWTSDARSQQRSPLRCRPVVPMHGSVGAAVRDQRLIRRDRDEPGRSYSSSPSFFSPSFLGASAWRSSFAPV
jgi:hypothetical protein